MLSEKVIALVYELLPGFLAAWIFYGLTSHPKASEFERIVQALVFTGIVKCIVLLLKTGLEWIGHWYPVFGKWRTEQDGFDANLIASFASAVVLGFLVSVAANKDWLHSFLRKKGLTLRTSKPSELVNALDKGKGFIRLNMKNGDLIGGWNTEFPDGDDGYFVVDDPEVLRGSERFVDPNVIQQMIVPAKDVMYIQLQRKHPKPVADPVPPPLPARLNAESGSVNGVPL